MRKYIFAFLIIFLIKQSCLSQTVITMKRQGGVSIVPCKVNGLDLSFIFDTGASDVSISLTEAIFMLKNGMLLKSDIVGLAYYTNANGQTSEGYVINLREIEFAGLKLYNVRASIMKDMDAPLLLGQSAIKKLGPIQLDLVKNTLTILNGNSKFDYSSYSQSYQNPNRNKGNLNPPKDAPVDVLVHDENNKGLSNLLVAFKSKNYGKEYQGFTNQNGAFSLNLPSDDVYEIYIIGEEGLGKDNSLKIPALNNNQYYKNPFKVDIQYEFPKSIENCLFEFQSHDLFSKSFEGVNLKNLNLLFEYLRTNPNNKIEIGGHTEINEKVKKDLSINRAKAVRNFLISMGISITRIKVIGYESKLPAFDNSIKEGRILNRRTEIKVLE